NLLCDCVASVSLVRRQAPVVLLPQLGFVISGKLVSRVSRCMSGRPPRPKRRTPQGRNLDEIERALTAFAHSPNGGRQELGHDVAADEVGRAIPFKPIGSKRGRSPTIAALLGRQLGDGRPFRPLVLNGLG